MCRVSSWTEHFKRTGYPFGDDFLSQQDHSPPAFIRLLKTVSLTDDVSTLWLAVV